jgi:hypothetical protein
MISDWRIPRLPIGACNELSSDESIVFALVEPSTAQEEVLSTLASYDDLIEEPACTEAGTVVLDEHLADDTEIDACHIEDIGSSLFKVVFGVT